MSQEPSCFQLVDGMRIAADQVGGDASGVLRGENADARNFQLHELSAGFGLRSAAGRENQVARVLHRPQHRRDDVGRGNEGSAFCRLCVGSDC